MSAEPTRFFRTEALRQRIELINHLIEFGRQVIVINGEPGIGKTTLLSAIEDAADDGWRFISFKAGPTLNRGALLDKLAAQLDFEPTQKFSEEEICAEIQRRLEILENSNQLVVVTIDDAEELPSDTHSLLLKLAHNDSAATELRVLMAADNTDATFIESLQQAVSHEALIHSVDLPRLNRDQTASLLSWWADQPDARQRKFSTAEIDAVFAQANGVPGHSLTLARQAKLTGVNRPFRGDPVKRYVLLGAIGLIVLSMFAFFAKQPNESAVQELTLELPAEPQPALPGAPSDSKNNVADKRAKVADQGAVTKGAEVTSPPSTKSISLIPSGSDPAKREQPASSVTKAAASTSPPEPDASLVVGDSLDDLVTANLVDDLLPHKAAKRDEANAMRSVPEVASNINPTTKKTPPKVEVTIRQPNKETLAKKSPLPPPPRVKTSIPPPKSPKPTAAATSAAPKPVERSGQKSSSYSLAGLLRRSPNGYVLQLFGVRDRAAAVRYLNQHGIAERATIIATTHEEAPWYVVIYGEYANRDAAIAGKKSLPSTLNDVSPWPRAIASLK